MPDRAYATPDIGTEPKGARTVPVAENADALLARIEAAVIAGNRGISRADAMALHAIAVRSARGHGAFEIAIGEGLDLILRRGGLARLGSSGLGDLVRERLGMKEGEGRRLRRNAEKLRDRPLLRAAVVRGEVTSRKAEVLLGRTEPADDAYWTARARVDPVRRLEAALHEKDGEPEEDWHRLELALPPEHAVIVKTALEYARILEGPAAPYWHLVEVMLMEFLGEFDVEGWEGARPSGPANVEHAPGTSARPATRVAPSPSTAAQAASDGPFDPEAELRNLQALVRERASLDERLRRACLLVRETGAWRWAGFHGFTFWGAEAIGLCERTVRLHLALERRLRALPPLREALRSGKLSVEQARQVARHATPENVATRIAGALGKPVITTRREADAEEDRKTWDTSKLRLSLPERVAVLLRAALRSGRHHFPGLTPGEIVVCIAAHCILTWKPEVDLILKTTDKVFLRDEWVCQVPGCSRPAEHLHHVWFRSQGGPDARWNLLGLCVPHHLFGVHMGYIEISGRAPDGLTFIVGEEAVRRARASRSGAPARQAA